MILKELMISRVYDDHVLLMIVVSLISRPHIYNKLVNIKCNTELKGFQCNNDKFSNHKIQ